ncbi:beta-glucosidase [Modestobacter sp. I12A-02628]|uniref:Beta-glucosidase n=1 Tax=Goekera deserti TaxID=2497753 RepID=A0A7K3WGU8_9ACTN|nr:GH1 family beta-glucosidase [Goekera deserti]MPQ98024.1 beta-glucosidase [Goekera deserti]NDI48671.1 beta-glucosidase [Goekera deserti]NEL54950.1 beta-glucosidase [Goekera deserti]
MTSTDVRPDAAAALTFPPGFFFGAATASYQIEGAVDVDGRGPSIWDTFSHTPGKTHQGDTGDVAVEHHARYREDVALMADLGLQAYRFSIAWPRVLPQGAGRVEQRGLDFYRRLVDELLGQGIDPWPTLYHWDLPQALQDEGGWTNRDTAARFADYAAVVHDALGDRVRHWSTLNEPMCSALLGHQAGQHAPGERDAVAASRAVHHLLLGHGLAAGVLRDRGVDHLGITLNFTPMTPATDSPADVDAARRLDGQQNRMFLEPIVRGAYPADVVHDLAAAGAPLPVQDGDLEVIAAPLDWLGVNYYFCSTVRAVEEPTGKATAFIGGECIEDLTPEGPTTTMGWGVHPQGFTDLLLRLRDEAPGLPLVITENGSAWPDEVAADGQVHDGERTDYLVRHLAAMTDAMTLGADVRGYFAWSLLDNYEWARGYAQRFGLVHVDYATQQRTPKASARVYADLIARHTQAG